MKRTMTIRFELTQYQYHQIKALGRTLWPDQSFSRDELCRRVLLVGADRMLVGDGRERLLEAVCQPSPKPIAIDSQNQNTILMATRP